MDSFHLENGKTHHKLGRDKHGTNWKTINPSPPSTLLNEQSAVPSRVSTREALRIAEQFITITDLELNKDKGTGNVWIRSQNQSPQRFPIHTPCTSSIHDLISTSIAADPTMFTLQSTSATFQLGDDEDDDDELLALESLFSEEDDETEDCHNPTPCSHKHTCKVCASPVSYATNRKNHVIAHLGLKPWKCPICFKHYTRPHSTALHISKFHPAEQSTAAPVYDLSAKDAQTVEEKIIEYFPGIKRQPVQNQYAVNTKIGRPRKSQPLGQELISCQVCHKEIRDTATGKSRHVLTHCHVKPWKCALCNSYYTRPSLVTPHFAKMHPGVTVRQMAVYQLAQNDESQIYTKTNECFPITWKRKSRHHKSISSNLKHQGDPETGMVSPDEESDDEQEFDEDRELMAEAETAQEKLESEDKRRQWMHVVERISPIREEANVPSSSLSSDDQLTLTSSRPTSSNTILSEDVAESLPESSESTETSKPKIPSALSACKICGKQFGYTSNKKRHVMFHMRLTPFQCPSCDSKFAHITTASKHFNQKHSEQEFKPAIYTLTKKDEDAIDESIQKLFPLSAAPKVQAGKRKARETCQICMKSVIGSATDRKRHIIVHMGIKPWKCTICDEAFTRQNVVQDHIKKKHPGVHVKTAVSKLTKTEEEQFQEHLKICFPDVWTRKKSRIVHTPVHKFL